MAKSLIPTTATTVTDTMITDTLMTLMVMELQMLMMKMMITMAFQISLNLNMLVLTRVPGKLLMTLNFLKKGELHFVHVSKRHFTAVRSLSKFKLSESS